MPRPHSPRRHSRSPRRQVSNRRHRSPSPRSRSQSRGRTSKQYSRDSPPAKTYRRRESPSPPPKRKYGGRRSRSYSPAGRRSRSPNRGYDNHQSGRSSPKTYRDQSPDYYQKPKDSMPTFVVNRDRSYSPDRRQGNGRQQYDERPRDLDARLREIEARSPEMTKSKLYAKEDYKQDYSAGTVYEKPRSTSDYRRGDRSPDDYQDRRSSRNYDEPTRKDTYDDDNYQASGRSFSPQRRESRDQRRTSSTTERKQSKDSKNRRSPDRYQSPEPERRHHKESDSRRDRRERESSNHRDRARKDDDKYYEKKETSTRSSRRASSRDGHEKSHRSSNKDRSREPDSKTEFDPSLVIVPRRKDEGRGGIFDRPEITMRPLTDDPDNQAFEEKRVVAVMPGKPLPGPALTERDIHRDYLEMLARKSAAIGDFEIHKNKYRDLSLAAPQTLSSRFQGASSLELLATLENIEINHTKTLQRELELRREVDDLLRDRSPIRVTDLHSGLEGRLGVIERKVEPKNPRDLRHDLESRRKQLKTSRTDSASSSRRVSSKKSDKDSKLRMTSSERRPVRERLGLSPGKKERERRGLDRRNVEDRVELPDFKREVEELQKAQWMEDPKSVPKGPGYFEHDDRQDDDPFAISPRGRGARRGRGIPLRGLSTRGRGFFRGSFRGSFNSRARGFGRGRGGLSFRGRGGRYSPQWKHDKFDDEKKEKEHQAHRDVDSKSKLKKPAPSSHRSRSDDRHSGRRDERKSKDIRETKRSTERRRDTSGSRRESGRDSRKGRR